VWVQQVVQRYWQQKDPTLHLLSRFFLKVTAHGMVSPNCPLASVVALFLQTQGSVMDTTGVQRGYGDTVTFTVQNPVLAHSSVAENCTGMVVPSSSQSKVYVRFGIVTAAAGLQLSVAAIFRLPVETEALP
jgi:hypothetical protein